MQPNNHIFLLLAFLTTSSYSTAQETVVVGFEQFPVSSNCYDYNPPLYDRGATISGGAVRTSYFSGINATKVYSTFQYTFSYCYGRYNPVQIYFDEPASEVRFDLMTANDFFTIEDDTGWSQVISVRAGRTGSTYYGTTVQVPSSGMSHITITDHCDYYATTGCRSEWHFAIDNVTFTPQRPCLAVNGPHEVEPNAARQTTKDAAVFVEVTDCNGNPLSEIDLTIKIVPVEQSGGHLHEVVPFAFRPAGGLREENASGAGEELLVRASDPSGLVQLEFVPPEVSGTYAIEVECAEVACNEPNPPHEIEVKIAGLEPIPQFDVFYTLKEYLPGTVVGKNIGDNGNHDGKNHWLKPEASEALWRLAFNYALLLEFHPDPQRLHINDASLRRLRLPCPVDRTAQIPPKG